MSQLKLTGIARSKTTTTNGLGGPIEIRFGEQRVWGPYQLQPGQSIDFAAPPAGVPLPTSAGPFNAPDYLQLFDENVPELLGLPADENFPLVTDSTPIGALPLGPGMPHPLVYPDETTIYTLTYEVTGNVVTATVAFLLGTGGAIVTFITTIALLVVNYVRSLLFLAGRLFTRPGVTNSRPNDLDQLK